MKRPEDIPTKKILTRRERDVVKGVIDGNKNPNLPSLNKLLSRPHVAVTFEAILDQAGLNDSALAGRVADIIKRKPIKSVDSKTGRITTNQPAIDANTLSAIKMVWQAEGKFVEKTEIHHSGSIQKMDDDALDSIINQGQSYLNNRLGKHDEPNQK